MPCSVITEIFCYGCILRTPPYRAKNFLLIPVPTASSSSPPSASLLPSLPVLSLQQSIFVPFCQRKKNCAQEPPPPLVHGTRSGPLARKPPFRSTNHFSWYRFYVTRFFSYITSGGYGGGGGPWFGTDDNNVLKHHGNRPIHTGQPGGGGEYHVWYSASMFKKCLIFTRAKLKLRSETLCFFRSPLGCTFTAFPFS